MSETEKLPAGLEVYDSSEIRKSAYLRALIMGAGRIGKTTAVLKTAPKPILVLNADTWTATGPAARAGAEFRALDIRSRRQWQSAIDYALGEAAAGTARTVVLDTITMLGKTIATELWALHKGEKNKFVVFRELEESLTGGVERLATCGAHLVVIAHIEPKWEDSAGIVPSIEGSSKKWVPQMLDDWIPAELDEKGEKLQFLLGWQGNWGAAPRSTQVAGERIAADIHLLLSKLGIDP